MKTFRQLPVHVFTELVSEVFLELGSTPHVLHAVIQPQMVECRLPSTLRLVQEMALIKKDAIFIFLRFIYESSRILTTNRSFLQHAAPGDQVAGGTSQQPAHF